MAEYITKFKITAYLLHFTLFLLLYINEKIAEKINFGTNFDFQNFKYVTEKYREVHFNPTWDSAPMPETKTSSPTEGPGRVRCPENVNV